MEVAKNLLEREQRHSDDNVRPLLLTSTVAQQSVVKRCCKLATHAGVKRDSPINLAQALTHNPLILPFKPLQEYRALFRLALRALSLSPLVALDNDLSRAFNNGALLEISPEYSGFMLDISGTERLHRGEELLAQRLFKALSARGITARIAITPNIGCAWALSRYSSHELTIVPNDLVRDAMVALPIASLRLEPAVTTALNELGLYVVDALLRLPLKDIGLRFGVQSLRRIHQALGTVDEHFEAISPEPRYTASKDFEIPIENLSAAQEITLQLLRALLTELNLYGLKAGSFLITFTTRLDYSGDTQTHNKEIALQSASNATASIMHIVGPVIESFKIPGAIVSVLVTAQAITRHLNEQQQIFESPYAKELQRNAEELLNNLTARLGVDQVKQITLHQSYIPERSFSYVPTKTLREGNLLKDIAISPAIPTRPPQIFRNAEKISAVALLPDRPPARITWRGATYKIINGKGPERIAPEWWRGDSITNATRDYFTLQDHTGRWLWVYRNIPNLDWWIHGIF